MNMLTLMLLKSGQAYIWNLDSNENVFVAPSILSQKLFYVYCRYKAIVWPLKRRTSKYIVFGTILVIWIGSAMLAIPALLFSRT